MLYASSRCGFCLACGTANLRSSKRTLAVVLLAMTQAAIAQLPPVLPESGPLLMQEPLGSATDLGVYGPISGTTDEPTIVTLLLLGGEDTSIEQGFILLGAPEAAINFTQSPTPAGFYTPYGRSSTTDTQWHQLLTGDPVSLWSLHLITMTHPHYRLSTGTLLDNVLFSREQSQPRPDPVFGAANDRVAEEYETLAVAFVTRETQGAEPASQSPQDAPSQHGARAIRISFPIDLGSPDVTFGLWVTVQLNGQYVTRKLSFSTAPRRTGLPNTEASTDTPVIDSPKEHAVITGPVIASGQAKPGVLVVAWLQPIDYPDVLPQKARRICDRNGKFRITVPVPPLTAYPAEYELHIRTEAPGFESPEVVRPLTVHPSQ